MTYAAVMRRAVLVLALLAAVAACAPGEPVALLTSSGNPGCFVANTTGMLIADPSAGTAIIQEDMGKQTVGVRWPEGYTGRRSGNGVEVLDRAGHAVARTGERYELLGGYNTDGTWAACVDGVRPPLNFN
jgi:hypothetical protein